jgi:hypothetical protein
MHPNYQTSFARKAAAWPAPVLSDRPSARACSLGERDNELN